ncbi:MAG: NADH-quinone oxidoreductase subunit C [Nitrospira sp.]|nr:NADH-quinone oxidoreductase subunit C [Nitrospira sp.]
MTQTAIVDELRNQFGSGTFGRQETGDGIPTVWTTKERAREVLGYLKTEAQRPYKMLYDLTAIDERVRRVRQDQSPSDFTVVYHLLSFERNEDVRLKIPLTERAAALPTITDLWPAANWYEREVWDLFGITFVGHPHLRRILMPPTWQGHPLRKDHPARATEIGRFYLPEDKQEAEEAALKFRPEEWGMKRSRETSDFMFLNMGPAHTGTHGILRLVLQLDEERIVDVVPDIGYHHRGAEKMSERQTWHTFIPYTDRIDYLGGVMNELPYVLAVEKLAGIDVPDRAKVIRVMMAEFFRLASHLVWYGTFAQDVGQLSPVFYMFTDRERIFHIVEAIEGGMIKVNVGELQPRFIPTKGVMEKGEWSLKKGDRIELAVSAENLVVDYHPVNAPGWHRIIKGQLAQPLIVGYEWAVIRTDDGKEEAFAVRPLARLKVAALPIGVPALFLIGEAGKILDATFVNEELAPPASPGMEAIGSQSF